MYDSLGFACRDSCWMTYIPPAHLWGCYVQFITSWLPCTRSVVWTQYSLRQTDQDISLDTILLWESDCMHPKLYKQTFCLHLFTVYRNGVCLQIDREMATDSSGWVYRVKSSGTEYTWTSKCILDCLWRRRKWTRQRRKSGQNDPAVHKVFSLISPFIHQWLEIERALPRQPPVSGLYCISFHDWSVSEGSSP